MMALVQRRSMHWAGSALAAGAIGAAARRKRALTVDGAAAATIIGTVVMARGGLPAAAALVAFFVTSSALSRFKEREKMRRGVLAQAKGGERDAWQVLANGGVAAACLGIAGERGTAAFLGALATAGADTWATELGLLSRRAPRLLTTLRRVPPGTSGGVTAEGTLAGVAGALAVGAAWAGARRLPVGLRQREGATTSVEGRAPREPRHDAGTIRSDLARAMVAAGLAGTLGCLADSLLGATVQASYWCATCQEPTETPVHRRCGQAAARIRGWGWMNNDVVNALAAAAGALAGSWLEGLFTTRQRDPLNARTTGRWRRRPPARNR